MGHKRNLRPETVIEQFERAVIRQFEMDGVRPSMDTEPEEIVKMEAKRANVKRQYLKTYNQLLRRLEETKS